MKFPWGKKIMYSMVFKEIKKGIAWLFSGVWQLKRIRRKR
jgi:hypothetical protein